ncbi:MAG: homoserine dehydrogenase [Ruminococcaceae bacterium]|nr:homoserine dehydrogenase [Oscillospiraceae bacterium]
MINVAILGFGVVGSGTAEVIEKNKDVIKEKTGAELCIKHILDLRDFPGSPFEKLITHDFNDIINDGEVDIVVEAMGGAHPAYDFSKAALEAGKHVVTSNKLVVAQFGTELLETAEKNGVRYLFEASVGGGIPIIKPMMSDLAQNRIDSVSGILNGTTNYILTQMSENGAEFSDALKEAQAKGYAEADPTSDIEGHDAARKIVILAALAYGKLISPDAIYCEGITKIDSKDVALAEKLGGHSIKLIGHAEKAGDKILAFVAPRLIPAANPLHDVSDVFNGILVSCDMLGDAMFYGRGAGKLPTASAVVSDVIDIAVKSEMKAASAKWEDASDSDIAPLADYVCAHYFRISGCEKCMAKVFESVERSVTENGETAFITKPISEAEAVAKEKAFAENGTKVLARIRVL